MLSREKGIIANVARQRQSDHGLRSLGDEGRGHLPGKQPQSAVVLAEGRGTRAGGGESRVRISDRLQ